jgi:hypothetical protein
MLKFQIASRLNFYVLWVQEKETNIHFLFLSKVPVNEHPPGSPTQPLWRELPVQKAFFTHLSNSS